MKNDVLIQQLRQKIMHNPYNARNHYELGLLLEEEKDINGAASEYELALKYNRKLFQAGFNLGMTYTMLKKYGNAIACWQKITDDDDNIRIDKINYRLKPSEISFCVSAWENHFKEEQPTLINRFQAGLAFTFLGDLKKANDFFVKLLKENTNFEFANYYAAITHMRLGEYDKAAFYFSEESKLKPNYMPVIYATGELLYKQNRLSQAAKCFDQILRIKPNHVMANFHMALIESSRSSYDKAFSAFKKLLELDPSFTEARVECAKIFEKTFKLDKAIEEYNTILKDDPLHKYANLHLAAVYKKLGKTEIALNHFQKVIKIDPADDEAIYNAGEVLAQLGRYEDAEKEFKKVLTIVPKHGYAYYSLGLIYLKLNKLASAAESFKKALEINPKDTAARNFLGVVYFKTGNLTQSVEEFEKVLQENPQDTYSHYYLGAVHFRMQNFEAAIKEYQKISDLNPQSAYAHFALGAAFSRGENFENAISQFEKAADLVLGPEVDMVLFATLQLLAVIGIEHAKQGKKVTQLYNELEESYKDTVKSLAKAVDAKDKYTQFHSDRVAKIAGFLAKELGLSRDEITTIEMAGYLHDIGKIGIKDDILLKPGKLTKEEETTMHTHPVKGAEILKEVKVLKDITPLVKYHHENMDGSGYPEKLKSEQIPLGAKIIGISDFYDALVTERPYKKALSLEETLSEIKKIKGVKYDDFIVDAFIKIFDKLPDLLENLKPAI